MRVPPGGPGICSRHAAHLQARSRTCWHLLVGAAHALSGAFSSAVNNCMPCATCCDYSQIEQPGLLRRPLGATQQTPYWHCCKAIASPTKIDLVAFACPSLSVCLPLCSFNPNDGVCTPCPVNAQCEGSSILPKPGYWLSSRLSSQLHRWGAPTRMTLSTFSLAAWCTASVWELLSAAIFITGSAHGWCSQALPSLGSCLICRGSVRAFARLGWPHT